jgi:hypothetical protein
MKNRLLTLARATLASVLFTGMAVAQARPNPANPPSEPAVAKTSSVSQLTKKIAKGSKAEAIEAAEQLKAVALQELKDGRKPAVALISAIPVLQQQIIWFANQNDPLAKSCFDVLQLLGNASVPIYVELFKHPKMKYQGLNMAANSFAHALENVSKPNADTQRSLAEASVFLAGMASSDVAISDLMPYIMALDKIGVPAVPAILDRLNQAQSPEIRRRFVLRLDNIGPPANAALPALQKLKDQETDASLLKAVDEAITKIKLQ